MTGQCLCGTCPPCARLWSWRWFSSHCHTSLQHKRHQERLSLFLLSLSQGHSDWVTDVSVSADRKLVASASKVPVSSVSYTLPALILTRRSQFHFKFTYTVVLWWQCHSKSAFLLNTVNLPDLHDAHGFEALWMELGSLKQHFSSGSLTAVYNWIHVTVVARFCPATISPPFQQMSSFFFPHQLACSLSSLTCSRQLVSIAYSFTCLSPTVTSTCIFHWHFDVSLFVSRTVADT